MVRRKTDRLIRFSYQTPGAVLPSASEKRVADVCAALGITISSASDESWDLLIHDSTRVFGFVSREVEEAVSVRIVERAEESEIRVSCEPAETHAAHSVGAAGVLVFAASAWIAGGLSDGALAAVATIAAGWLVVEVTRHWAFEALERRVRGLTEALGRSFWPDQDGQII